MVTACFSEVKHLERRPCSAGWRMSWGSTSATHLRLHRHVMVCPWHSRTYIHTVQYFFWNNSPQRTRSSSLTRFLDHTQRHTTVGRTPLHEWLARRRDLYLTTHNTHNRQTFMSPVGFEPTVSALRAAADLRLRPRGQWGRRFNILGFFVAEILSSSLRIPARCSVTLPKHVPSFLWYAFGN